MNEAGPLHRGLRERRRLRRLPVRSILPNMLTVLALCAGLTSIRLGLEGRFELGVAAIMVAVLLDGLDGRLARLLGSTTRFGAELDSLTDFVNFGVAPVLLLYSSTLHDLGGVGWIATLAYSVCCALRLARFNIALDDPDQPAWASHFFVGVPAPAGAGLVLLPLYLGLMGADWMLRLPLLVAFYVTAIALLMISRLPTLSLKGVRVRREMVLPLLVAVALLAALLFSYPWMTLSALAVIYLAVLPFALLRHRRYARGETCEEDGEEDGEEDETETVSPDS